MWRDVLFVVMFALVFEVAYNAREAHRHLHEIACEDGKVGNCKYVNR